MGSFPPNVLKSIAANPAAYPGSPPSPVDPKTGGTVPHGAPAVADPTKGAPKSEPADLHDKAMAAKDLCAQARAALEELASDAQMANLIDPGTEKSITDAYDQIQKVDDAMQDAVDELGNARADHEALTTPDAG